MGSAKVLLLGATGGIGSTALVSLLDRGVDVTAIVRSEARLPKAALGHKQLTSVVHEEGALGMELSEFSKHVQGCDAVISCLGHTMDFKGLFGHPRDLCLRTTKLACDTISELQPAKPTKYIVVNTVGVDHPDGQSDPPRTLVERALIWLLTVLLPPMNDNVKTSHYLYKHVMGSKHVEFCCVRPDDLLDGDERPFTVHATLQNGLFNAGVTTRSNVGKFMADLVTNQGLWLQWKGKYPQIIDVQGPKDKAS